MVCRIMNFSLLFFSFCIHCLSLYTMFAAAPTQYIFSLYTFFFPSICVRSFSSYAQLSPSLSLFLYTYHDLFDSVDFIEIIFRVREMLVSFYYYSLRKLWRYFSHSGMYHQVIQNFSSRDTLVKVYSCVCEQKRKEEKREKRKPCSNVQKDQIFRLTHLSR